MTIDEALKKYKEKSEFFKKTTNVSYALELEQIVKWLEELKTTRIALEKANGCLEANWKLGYQKAIEDFADYAGDILSTNDRDFYCSGVIDGIAKQLKEAGAVDD